MARKDRDNDAATERDNGNPDVVWQLSGDALRPSPAPFGFIGRNPVDRIVPPGTNIRIDLQITANVPVLAFPVRRHGDTVRIVPDGMGGSSKEGAVVIQPGTSVVVDVQNSSSQAPMVVEDKEGLVALHPLVFSGTSAVG